MIKRTHLFKPLYQPHLLDPYRERGNGRFASSESDGFNGRFFPVVNGLRLCVIGSDGSDPEEPVPWEHVSVSILDSTFTPSWDVMCKVKDMFWGPNEWVVQFHPPTNENINNHPGCLHLWRPTVAMLPLPDKRQV